MSARSSNISRRSSRSVSEETVKITLARLRAEEERAEAEREKILADQAELLQTIEGSGRAFKSGTGENPYRTERYEFWWIVTSKFDLSDFSK
jgi:hypothetical protein